MRCIYYFSNLPKILEDYLRQIDMPYLRMDGIRILFYAFLMKGSTKPEDRAVMINDFNAPNSKYNVFMLRYRIQYICG